jgi:YDG domain/Bacterial Ig-like domain (group 3)/MBG domain (YGX type)
MKVAKNRAAALFITLLMNGFSLLAANTATQLVFTTQPTNSIVGAGITNVVVQLADKGGTNVAQSGITILLTLNKGGGLSGTTNLITDASGKVAYANLKISQGGNGDTLVATSSGLKNANSSAFNVSKGGTATALVASTNFLVYGQGIIFTATVSVSAPASGTPTGTVTFKDGAATLGTGALNVSGIATFSTNRISAATTNRDFTAVFGGDSNFSNSTSGIFALTAGKRALTVAGVVANNKVYDGSTNAILIFSNATLVTIVAGDTVTLNSAAAKGAFANKTTGTNKAVSVSGLVLAGASAANYSVSGPTATANITPRNLAITAKGVNKVYDGTVNATVTLTNNQLAGDVFTNSYSSATFSNKNAGTAILINVSGLAIGGTDAVNYALTNLTATNSANITAAALAVSGITASNKVYDATTAAGLTFSSAKLTTIFGSDAVTLNITNARGTFASKIVGNGKNVTVSGLALAGTNAGNYTLTLSVTTTANITARSLTLTAKGVSKIYDGTTNATVTLTDNRVTGDVFTSSYTRAAFTNKNVGTNLLITVSGLAIAGTDSTNYVLSATSATASANITKAALAVLGVVANNKTYDATTTATLNFSNATLVAILSGDNVALNSATAKGTFASRTVGTNKTVAVTGLTLVGTSSNNYALTQPTTTASITARLLAITAKGVNKIYDGMTNATVTLTDNRVAGDVLTNSYASAAFTNKNAGTNFLIDVSGLAIAGTDAASYYLPATNTTATANISQALLTVAAANLARPYATTNPVLVAVYSNFVAGESLTNSDLTGSPSLTATTNTNSIVGTYPITIGKGSLATVNYSLKFTNGILTVTKADTAALLTTTLNPALTNQNITFAAKINPLATTVLPAAGVIQFKCNGTNKLGNALSVSNGVANLTVLAATLGQSNAVITAEYSDPAGNFNSSTNSLMQNIVTVVTPPPPSKLSLVPSFAKGNVTAQLFGVAGQSYIIQASSDLVIWTSISTNIADAAGIVSLVDSNSVAFPARFYRAYSP